jgi:serine/threonine protein kinase
MVQQTQNSGRELPVGEIQRHSGTRLPSKDDIFSVTQTRRAGKDQLQQILAGQPKKSSGTAVPKPPSMVGTKPAQRELTPRVPPKSTWNLRIHQRNIHGDVAGVVNDVPETRDGISGLQAAMVTDQSSAEFDILGQLGMGNMGVVYRARQASLNRELAIKTLKPHEGDNSHDFQAMFVSEAVVTANLLHPNIVPIHDLGRTADGKLFYSMKQVSGTPWSRIIRDRSLEDNLEIFMKVCDAVAYAHSSGVVNRDLKPENVIVGGYGEVVVLDWGLAITTEKFSKRNSIALNYEGGWGTPPYMAPELLDEDIQYMGPHSDIYLLGAILFEVLQGFPPHFLRELWEMEDQDEFESMLLTAVRDNQIEQEVTQQGELHDIALRAMSTYPEDRFESVEALQDAIRQYRITGRAEELLLAAEDENGDRYGSFQGAIALYDEALRKWPGNPRAVDGNRRARLAYAELAGKKGDIDLGLQVVDRQTDPQFVPLAASLTKSRRFRRIVRTTWSVMTVAVGILLVGITYQWNKAITATNAAIAAKNEAVIAEEKAREEKAKAEKSERDLVAAVGEREVVKKQKESLEKDAKSLQTQKKELQAEAERQKVLADENKREAVEQSKKAIAATAEAAEATEEAEVQQKIALEAGIKAKEESAKASAAIANLADAEKKVQKAIQQGHEITLTGFSDRISTKLELGLDLDVIAACEEEIKYRNENKIANSADRIKVLETNIRIANGKVKPKNLKKAPDTNMSAISADGSTVVVFSKDVSEPLQKKEGEGKLNARDAKRPAVYNVEYLQKKDGEGLLESADSANLSAYMNSIKLSDPKISLSGDGSFLAVYGRESLSVWHQNGGALKNLGLKLPDVGNKKSRGRFVTCQFSADSGRLYLFRDVSIERANQTHVDIFTITKDSAELKESLNLKKKLTERNTIVVLTDESAVIAATERGVQAFFLNRNDQGQIDSSNFGDEADTLKAGYSKEPSRIFVSRSGKLLALVEKDKRTLHLLQVPDGPTKQPAKSRDFPFQEFDTPVIVKTMSDINDMGFTADDSRVITAHDKRYIQVWDRVNNQWKPSEAKGLFQHTLEPGSSLRGHSKAILHLSFIGESTDELVSLSSDRTVRTWSISGYDAYWKELASLTAATSGTPTN